MVCGRSLQLSWLKPEIAASDIADHYLVSWGKNGSGTFDKKQVVSSPFLHDFGKYVHYLIQRNIPSVCAPNIIQNKGLKY